MAGSNGTHSDIRRILVLGDIFPASSIIPKLADANFEVHVVHPNASSLFERVIYHDSNTSSESLRPILKKVQPEVVVSTVRGGSFDAQKEIIDCAIDAGVSRFIPSEFGQDSLNEKVQERLPPSREKARTVKYLQELVTQGRISWVGVATGVALDRGLLRGNAGFDIKWQSATLHGRGHEQFAASSGAWIGMVVVAIIEHWEAVKNQYLYAAAMITSGDEIVASLEQATGKTFETSRQDPDETVVEAEKRIERGFPDAGMFLMERSVMYDERLGAVQRFRDADAKIMLNLDGETLQVLIKSVMHEHEHHGGKHDCGCG